jgi:hypothetical protein
MSYVHGVLTLTQVGDGLVLEDGDGEVHLDADGLRWLIWAAGPAALCAVTDGRDEAAMNGHSG